MGFLKVRILTPEGVVFEGESGRVALQGSRSPFVVLPGHAPIITALDAGVVGLDGDRRIATGPGVARVMNDEVTVCVVK